MHKIKRLIILVLVAGFCSSSIAQERLPLKDFNSYFEKRINQLHFEILDGILREKPNMHWNDSFATLADLEDIKLRISESTKSVANGRLDPNFIDQKKNPAILVSYKRESDFENDELKFKTLGVTATLPLLVSGVDLGLNPTGWITMENLPKVLNTRDFKCLKAIQGVTRNTDINEFRYWDSTENDLVRLHIFPDYWEARVHARVDSSKVSYLSLHLEQCLREGLRSMEFSFAGHKTKIYRDLELKTELEPLQWTFYEDFITQIQDPDLPDDPFALMDTVIRIPMELYRTPLAFYVHKTSSGPVLEVNMTEAKSDHGGTNFFLPLAEYTKFLTTRDRILVEDFIDFIR